MSPAEVGWFMWGAVLGLVVGWGGTRGALVLLLHAIEKQSERADAIRMTTSALLVQCEKAAAELDRKRALWQRYEIETFERLTGKAPKDARGLLGPEWDGPEASS